MLRCWQSAFARWSALMAKPNSNGVSIPITFQPMVTFADDPEEHLTLHYQLGLLILFDILDRFGQRALIPNCDNLHSSAAQDTINIIMLGMQYKVPLRSVLGSSLSSDRQHEMVSLLSIDPYPHHVATALEYV
jgi:hypothetical protein